VNVRIHVRIHVRVHVSMKIRVNVCRSIACRWHDDVHVYVCVCVCVCVCVYPLVGPRTRQRARWGHFGRADPRSEENYQFLFRVSLVFENLINVLLKIDIGFNISLVTKM
jgi:hypothetical protein